MKKIKIYLSFAVVFSLLFASCSKDEQNLLDEPEGKTSTLSFATLLNDLTANKASLKQAIGDIPGCSDEAPAYVEVVLTGTTNVGTMANPIVVNINPNPGDYDEDGVDEYFTEESADLELEPGSYSLEFFAVYDTNDNLIWVAPMEGGEISTWVTNPLPMDIELGAGVKKYVDVEVLCFDDRMVNEYGYLFFDLETTEAFEFCFFANYCDENGRHFSAAYAVNIWLGDDDSGAVLYSGVSNTTGENNQGDFYADPLCFALPNLPQFEDAEDYLYYEVTLMDWTDNYGEVESTVLSGTLSRDDIEANFDGENVDYLHLRFGCGDDNGEVPVDSDDDGVPDSIDECPNTEEDVEVDEWGCAVNGETDTDGDGIPDSIDECPDTEEGVQVDNVGCPIQENDADGDGIPDSIDECPETPTGVEVDNVGCPIDTGECLDENGAIIAFNQIVDVTNFPVGQNPFYVLQVGGEDVGTITFNLDTAGEDDQLIVLIDMYDGSVENNFTEYTIISWELNLPDLGGEAICVSGISENQFEITYDSDDIIDVVYPLEVEFRANYIIAME
ncbi:thrombospondin type 3 repeat-containing protein [Salinimicrobium sp. GXAS 041]|uniref:thrombospondin type 3 repeat-containing protein n=1 Tax=Salinimicrobium sp. GXAS 041 TaxID=3400806 RepID=UPI003C761681